VPSVCIHGYKDLAVLFREPGQRAAAEAALSAEGVMTKRYFFPVHRMDVYQKFARRALPVTDWIHERLLCIPLYFDLPDARIDAVAQLIRASSIREPDPAVRLFEGSFLGRLSDLAQESRISRRLAWPRSS
jgi:dTDP-4-amino-4,6-dideoxygalactose transaminase